MSYASVRGRTALLVVLWLAAVPRLAAAQAPAFLVKDVAPLAAPVSSNPTRYVTIGATTFFAASTPTLGTELWRTDGTADGTVLVRDIRVGSESGIFPFGFRPSEMTASAGVLLLAADDGVSGSELYRSDGTAAGTVLVADVNPFAASSPTRLTDVDGTLFFLADDGVHGRELWRSDGTAAGTMLVKDIVTGDGSAFGGIEELIAFDGILLFTADDGVNGQELWRSDGTAAGTVIVRDIASGPAASTPKNLTASEGIVLFAATDGVLGTELWRSDGTTDGTVLVRDVNPGAPSSISFPFLADVDGSIFFAANDGVAGTELWKTDGTFDGTMLVRDILPGPGSSGTIRMTAVGPLVFFRASDGVVGSQLWTSDGTEAGTGAVEHPGGVLLQLDLLTNVDGLLFFRAVDNANGSELWRSDGTADGTFLVKDINPGSNPALDSIAAEQLVAANGVLLFTATDGASGLELWRSDGMPDGTFLVHDLAADVMSGLENPSPSTPQPLVDVAGTLLFRSGSPFGAAGIWKSDGTAAGTVQLATPGFPLELRSAGGLLYFETAAGGPGGVVHDLWRSDGTPSGTFRVSPGGRMATDVNGVAYFSGGGIFAGPVQLRRTDGTVGGTVVVKNFGNASGITSLTNVNGTMYFAVQDSRGNELWKSDGTEPGTVLVKDIHPTASSNPSLLTAVGSTLFFVADDGTAGAELWRSDGTADGTQRVTDLNPGPASSSPTLLVEMDGTLFFRATDGVTGAELWRSDGTVDGTVRVKDIVPGAGSSPISELAVVNGTLFFPAFDGVNGYELWKSDGTADGTAIVRDINPGFAFSFPEELTDATGRLVFRACEATTGCEVWESDGTQAGTQLLSELVPGTGDGRPLSFTVSGTLLFFAAADELVGRELWAIPGLPPTTSTSSTTTSSSTSTTSTTSTTIAAVLCRPMPIPTCIDAGKGTLAISEKVAGKETLRLELARMTQPVSLGHLGNPVTGTTRWEVCIYDEANRLSGAMLVDRARQMCGTRPCWTLAGSAYRYTDASASADGIRRMVAHYGRAGTGRVLVTGANAASKGQTSLPTGVPTTLAGATRVTVQVVSSDAVCFTAALDDVIKSTPQALVAKTP